MNKKLSSLSERFFDQYILGEYPELVNFFKIVFQYLEVHNNIFDLILNFTDRFVNIDNLKNSEDEIDLIIKDMVIQQYISQFPLYRLEDIDTIKLIKNAKDFYSIKGTEKSYRFMFSLLNHLGAFNFYYPENDILIVSDSENGILNSEKKIHDSYYYAYYVYEIQSTLYGYFELKDIVKNVLHPVGTKIFFLRIIQDTYDVEHEEDNVDYLVYSIHDNVDGFLTNNDIYNVEYGDIETMNEIYPLSLYSIDEIDDIYYTLENPDNEYYYYQMDFQFTSL